MKEHTDHGTIQISVSNMYCIPMMSENKILPSDFSGITSSLVGEADTQTEDFSTVGGCNGGGNNSVHSALNSE